MDDKLSSRELNSIIERASRVWKSHPKEDTGLRAAYLNLEIATRTVLSYQDRERINKLLEEVVDRP